MKWINSIWYAIGTKIVYEISEQSLWWNMVWTHLWIFLSMIGSILHIVISLDNTFNILTTFLFIHFLFLFPLHSVFTISTTITFLSIIYFHCNSAPPPTNMPTIFLFNHLAFYSLFSIVIPCHLFTILSNVRPPLIISFLSFQLFIHISFASSLSLSLNNWPTLPFSSSRVPTSFI